MTFSARYFKMPDDTGQDCEIALDGNRLHIYPKGENRQGMLIWNIHKLPACDYNGQELRLTYNPGTEWLVCEGEAAGMIYNIRNQPEPVVVQERRPLVSYTPFFVSLIVLVVLFLLAYFVLLPWLGRKMVSFVPVQMEISMGEALSKQYTAQYETNDSLDIYLNQFLDEFNPVSNYPLQVQVLKSDELNAFALPGGRMFVYSGMLNKLESYEELVALLGHESSHVIQRHSLKTVLRQAATGLVISAVFGDASEISAWVLSRADDFKQLDYSRELETEADDEGYKIMVQNKVDPNGMLRLLKLLKKESAEMPAMMKYLSTHPETDERIQNIEGKPGIKTKLEKNTKLQKLFTEIKRRLQYI